MKTKPVPPRLVTTCAAIAAFTSCAFAQDFTFTMFEGPKNTDVSPIRIYGYVNQVGSQTELRISNESSGAWVTANQPTITTIFFEDVLGGLNLPLPVIIGSTGIVGFEEDANLSLPGSANISWQGNDSAFAALSPPTSYGVDPGEDILFRFDDITSANLLTALDTGEIRIAMHIQEIDGNRSAAFVNSAPFNPPDTPSIPEPGVALLGSMGTLLLLRRRDRQSISQDSGVRMLTPPQPQH